METQSKTCGKCGENKPISDFYVKSRASNYGKDYSGSLAGYSSTCRKCHSGRMAERRKLLGDEYTKSFKDWEYRHKYGIGLDEYNQMFADQGGCCAICGKHQTEFKKSLAVDHNHETGKVRALLCVNCNLGVGCFKDDSSLLQAAIRYLADHSTTNTQSAQAVTDLGEKSGPTDDESVH